MGLILLPAVGIINLFNIDIFLQQYFIVAFICFSSIIILFICAWGIVLFLSGPTTFFRLGLYLRLVGL